MKTMEIYIKNGDAEDEKDGTKVEKEKEEQEEEEEGCIGLSSKPLSMYYILPSVCVTP